jgi:hypothetical protein
VISGELDRLHGSLANSDDGADIKVGLLRDLEHEGFLNALLRSPGDQFILSSFNLTQAGRLRLSALAGAQGWAPTRACVAFSESALERDEEEMLGRDLAARNVSLVKSKNLHAKVCVSSHIGYVGSYNFLSGDPFGTASGARELGIVISGVEGVSPLVGWAERRALV